MKFISIMLASALVYVTLPGVAMRVSSHEEVGRLPAMGYNTWNAYHCDINETIILQTARLMKSLGLADAGYTYMNIDDCYAEKNRSESGDIVAHKTRFPSGMPSLTKHIHAFGLNAGIYGDSGWFTCQLYPGSFGNEERDLKTWRDWGFDYLKYDNCAVPFDSITRENQYGKFQRMANAIKNLEGEGGKKMGFALCQWGRQQPWLWARKLGQSWRMIYSRTGVPYPASLTRTHSTPGLVTFMAVTTWTYGNGNLTYEEAKSHFTAWALMKSPLLISADLATASRDTLEILSNKEIIAINQDLVVGTSVSPFRWGVNPDWTFNASHPAQYWSGESQNGTVIMLLNTLNETTDMFFELVESPWIRAGRQYFVRDLWTHTSNGTAIRNFTAQAVPPHGVVALLLQDAGDEPDGVGPPCAVQEWCTDRNGTVIGG